MEWQRDEKLQTEQITPELIEYIVQKLTTHLKLEKIILFGSWARGTARANSDLNLFVVHDTNRLNREMRLQIERLLRDRLFGVDLIVRKPPEVAANLQDGNPFYLYHLFRDGRVIYDRTIQKTRGDAARVAALRHRESASSAP